MNVAWSALALALVAIDDSKPTAPQCFNFSLKADLTIKYLPADAARCQQAPANATAPPSASGPKFGEPSPRDSTASVPSGSPEVPKSRAINDFQARETWSMSLEQAIRIALDNSDTVRVISAGVRGMPVCWFDSSPPEVEGGAARAPVACCQDTQGDTLTWLTAGLPTIPNANHAPIVIARTQADTPVYQFKAEVMAHVRSVEQQYWKLAQAHAQCWGADRVVGDIREIINCEVAERSVICGGWDDIVESAQQLEKFSAELANRISDTISCEMKLRKILGLPASDNRLIIPVTPPTAPPIVFDWDSCVSEMMKDHPDVAWQEVLTHAAELRLLTVRKGMVFADEAGRADRNTSAGEDKQMATWAPGGTFQTPIGKRPPLVNTRAAQYALLRARAARQQVVDQTIRSLALCFRAIETDYAQYQSAERLRTEAAHQLDLQRGYYEEGRITIDRYFDAISKFVTAKVTEHQALTAYNASLAALSEAKGTLLADRNIVVVERLAHAKSTQ